MEKVLNKILEKLENLEHGQTEIKSDIRNIDKRLENVENEVGAIHLRLSSVETRFDNVESEVKIARITIENDIKDNIGLLFDGQITNSQKLDRLENKLDEVIAKNKLMH